jgi:regulator of sigma E protease
MSVLAFVLALAVLVTVHEWGHYRVAVAFGVRVECFSIGFGSPIFRWKRHVHGQDIEFVIGYIPLGGYVRMLDDAQPGMTADQSAMALNSQSLLKRALIVAAGPVANLILAVFLYSAVAMLGATESKPVISTPLTSSAAELAGLQSGDEIISVGDNEQNLQPIPSFEALRWWAYSHDFATENTVLQVISAKNHIQKQVFIPAGISGQGIESIGIISPRSNPVIGDVIPNSAAEKAGLKRGDFVLTVNDVRVDDALGLRQTIRLSGKNDQPLQQKWMVRRGPHEILELNVTPERLKSEGIYIGRIGAQIGAMPDSVWVQASGFEAFEIGWRRSTDVIQMTISSLWRILSGRGSVDELSGPVGMAEFAGKAAELGLGAYLSYLALISLSLFVLNLLPMPMLDGGHLMYYLLEAVRGKPLDASTMMLLQRVGLSLIVLLSLFTFYNDLSRLGWLKFF